LATTQISLALVHFSVAENPSPRYERLPDDLRKYVDDIRQHCKENDEGSQPKNPMQGISVVDLNDDGLKGLMVDAEQLCTTWIPGGNCSNRGCDLKIWKQTGRRTWQPVFDEHVSRKFVSVDEKGTLKLIAVSIWAGSPHCEPVAGKTYTSGESCDAIARYKDGKWAWMKIK
jgi:hypothetical protein